MPIHRVDLADQSSLLDIYATKASQSSLPKYRMPEGRTEPRAAYALIRDELLLATSRPKSSSEFQVVGEACDQQLASEAANLSLLVVELGHCFE